MEDRSWQLALGIARESLLPKMEVYTSTELK
jgi:hypothetical protein